MKMTDILLPNFAMFLLTTFVFVFNLLVRVQAAKHQKISPSYFKLFQGGSPTDLMLQAKNNISNLFETPIFFYLITITLFVTQTADLNDVIIAWIYVVCRVMHSAIHLTSNFVPFRFAAFLASLICLSLLWIHWATKVVSI